MKTFVLTTIVLLFSSFSQAYILPLDTILTKTAANAGTSIILVEQNVIFRNGAEETIIKEEWLIEGDRNLKLNATGTGALKDLFRVQYLYNGKTRTQVLGGTRQSIAASPDFFEKYLAVKSRDSYITYLRDLGIQQKVRLSRAGGSISFAIGEPSSSTLQPQIWIDQDFFRLMKIRMPSEAEIDFSDYRDMSPLHYPFTKEVRWADKSVLIKVIRVDTKPRATIQDFYPDTVTVPTNIQAARTSAGPIVEEFYQRFR